MSGLYGILCAVILNLTDHGAILSLLINLDKINIYTFECGWANKAIR